MGKGTQDEIDNAVREMLRTGSDGMSQHDITVSMVSGMHDAQQALPSDKNQF